MDTLRGEHVERRVKPVRTYPVGRVCEVEGCETRLSRYNWAPWCSVHAEPMLQPVRTSPKAS